MANYYVDGTFERAVYLSRFDATGLQKLIGFCQINLPPPPPAFSLLPISNTFWLIRFIRGHEKNLFFDFPFDIIVKLIRTVRDNFECVLPVRELD